MGSIEGEIQHQEPGRSRFYVNCSSIVQANGQSHKDGRSADLLNITDRLPCLYADAVVLKVWKTATETLSQNNPPTKFPETVPQSGKGSGRYNYREADFWTCGFFPGILYCLLERSIKYPHRFLSDDTSDRVSNRSRQVLRDSLLSVCRDWAQPLHEMAHRTDTHDIGFIIEPALRRDYELTGNPASLECMLTAAESLATRYDDKAKAIRSWDTLINNRHNYVDKESAFLVIIDSMCNLELLFYAGHHLSSQRLINIATQHAHTVQRTHVHQVPARPGARFIQYSTCHVANLSPETGELLERFTAQGYSDESTWARGQAWAILGYAQTYKWTRDVSFIHTACGLAEYFIDRMESTMTGVEVEGDSEAGGRYVPVWDFDAPKVEKRLLRDSSAGMIAANGMLLIHSSLVSLGDLENAQRFLRYAIQIAEDTIQLCFATDEMLLRLQTSSDGRSHAVADCATPSRFFEAILKNATANFNQNWTERFSDHGLVYGDYYFLEFGNRLLQMSL